MNRYATRSLFSIAATLALFCPLIAFAQQAAAKPYHEGPVWDVATIRVQPGMEERYLRYLADEWKREHEAMKKSGYVLDYRVIVTEPHSLQDFNVILLTEFKDLASFEADAAKREALAQQLFGGEAKIESGYQERAGYREIIGTRLGREIILAPKGAAATR